MSAEFERTLSGFRFVEIRVGDTLQQIAARELGSAARWIDLANLNGLVAPYLTGDPLLASGSVRQYGDLLMVPASSAVAPETTDPDAVYLVDCELYRGQLRDNGSGDIALVSGLPNLKQALSHRVVTERTDLVWHQEYGSYVRRLIGHGANRTTALLAARYVREALLNDERVQSVERVEVDVVGDTVRVDAEVVPVTGRPINISFEV